MESFEIDPYAAIRSAMSAEHSELPANEVTLTLGRMPATLVLHQLLNSPETRKAALAGLLGRAARRSVRFNGANVSIPVYLRLVSRLCREVAEQTHALETPGPGTAEMEGENQLAEQPCKGIIGRDDRVPVNRAWDIPYRWICQISSRSRKDGKLGKLGPAGTGVLISPRFVLTAAHVLWSSEKDERGQWVDSQSEQVAVIPARNEGAAGGNTMPFGRYEARGWKLCPKYNPHSADAWKHDYAVIELKESAGAKKSAVLSNALLYFWGSREGGGNTNLEVVGTTQLEGKTAYTAGYPGDLGGGTRPYSVSGTLSGVGLRGRLEIMNYDADGCRGQSGSPIWIEQDGKRYLVGIFTTVDTGHDERTGRVSSNTALRITQEMFDQISRWFEAAREDPWLYNKESLEENSSASVMEYYDRPVLDDRPILVERDVPKTSSRQVSVGQRVEFDLTTTFGADLDQVRWTIQGRVVRGYEGTTNQATLIELTKADLESPKISFFWVDAGSGRTVEAKIRRKSGAVEQVVQVFDVEGPRMNSFTGAPGATRVVKEHGTVEMQFGKPFDAPGINWKWKITMPAHFGGLVKDVQTVLADRSEIQRLAPGGKGTRILKWRHPKNPKPHVQLDGSTDNEAIYTPGLTEEKREAGGSLENGRGNEDSPRTGLASLDKTVSVNDQFTYYLLFKPDTKDPRDAIWVPVAKAKWSWNAAADQVDGTWNLRKAPKMEPAIDIATTDFPLYQSNARENEWQEASPASSHKEFEDQENLCPPRECEEEWTTELSGYEIGEGPFESSLFEGQVGGGGDSLGWASAMLPSQPRRR